MIGIPLVLALLLPADLASRIAAAPDGEVRMTFAARPGVCSGGRHAYSSSDNADVDWDDACERGPVHVVLWMTAHEPTSLHAYVGGRWRPRPGTTITDLGVVSAPEAADVLIGFAERLSSHVGREAIFPATLADSARIWPRLMTLARDGSKSMETRKQAVFWLGQAAADATGALDTLAGEPTVDREVREQAIFALSQRPRDEGVPVLIRIVKTNSDPELRRKAMFWLGQSGDPRALDLFESILAEPKH
jgi:HEAT repeat protein